MVSLDLPPFQTEIKGPPSMPRKELEQSHHEFDAKNGGFAVVGGAQVGCISWKVVHTLIPWAEGQLIAKGAMACCCMNDQGQVRCGLGGPLTAMVDDHCKLDVKEMNSDNNFYYTTETKLASKKVTVQKRTSLPTTTLGVLYCLERVGGGFTVYLT